ncbi:MAG TPA: DUF6406 domain-containing protein [Trebonia sp.]
MAFSEATLHNGIEASAGMASLTCLAPMVYPDGRVAVSVDVRADAGAGHEYLLHPGETFPAHDQTWKLDRIDNPGSDDWQVHLVRIS